MWGISYQDILAEVLNKKDDDLSGEEEEEQLEAEEIPITSSSEALHHLGKFHRYVEGQANISEVVFQSLNMLEEFVNHNRLNSAKQYDISSFFLKL